jgi:8-oxo-dGTP pyrophosphatase MutT (NUDIX family)
MKNWKTIKSKVAFKCRYFKVLDEDFMMPSGKKHKWFILKKNDYVVVIAKEKNYIYLIEQYRYTTKSKTFEFVAGEIEDGETSLQAARKELKEESGIIAKKMKKVGWYFAYKGCSDQKAHIFLAEDLKFGKQEPDDLEKESGIKVVKLKISEVKEMIKSEKIKDVDTLSAFCLFMLKN